MHLKKYDIGVIVGRFQVDELHTGHMQLISDVCARHNKCLIAIGVSPTLGSKEHPLDYATRQAMVKTAFPNAVVVPLLDNHSDNIWSNNLDILVRSVFPLGNVCLYGGRDSFIPYYHGQFDTFEFPTVNYKPAKEVRIEIGKKVCDSPDFRRGIIYSTQNQFPRVFTTVDIALIRESNIIANGLEVLLGRKPGQDDWRFPGGFIDQKESLEGCFTREAKEETNLEVNNTIFYVSSRIIDDWRYKNTSDSIMSVFMASFLTQKESESAKAGDDLVDVKWVPLTQETAKEVRRTHKDFYTDLLFFVKRGIKNG